MNDKIKSRWNDKCLDCVHTIQGTCPIEGAVKHFQDNCGLGFGSSNHFAWEIIEKISPYEGPCNMFFARVRRTQ